MPVIELDERQLAALREVLESELSELGGEIAATEAASYREQLKERKALLASILDALGKEAPTPG